MDYTEIMRCIYDLIFAPFTCGSDTKLDFHINQRAVQRRPGSFQNLKNGNCHAAHDGHLITANDLGAGLELGRYQLLLRPLRVMVLIILKNEATYNDVIIRRV